MQCLLANTYVHVDGLQMGSDIDKLKIGVAHAKALFEELYTQAGKQQPQLLGSIFLPSKRLLAQMKFR